MSHQNNWSPGYDINPEHDPAVLMTRLDVRLTEKLRHFSGSFLDTAPEIVRALK